MPDVPTLAESGYPGVDVSQWIGMLAPAATPPQAIAQLSSALSRALADPAVKQRLAGAGLEALGSTQEAFRERIRVESQARRQWLKQTATH
jgi:tripartite-type tricarboxylate transporter receptor subunit TctC